ncbi:cytochrome P450 [Auricularia subglabra TFB-10046 SS5]|nr:cytochrome P450 [Auricularia subglabra TFB-10046 SS5]
MSLLVKLAALPVAYAVYLTLKVLSAKKKIGYFPGFTLIVSSLYPIPMPKTIRGVIMRRGWPWTNKYNLFKDAGRDVISMTSFLPARATYHTCDQKAIFQMTTSRANKWLKPLAEFYAPSLAFGPNLVVSEGSDWKRMRKPVSPAFGDRNARLVWDTAVEVTKTLFETPNWKGKKEVDAGHIIFTTLRMALLVLVKAGFGSHISWDETDIPAGHTMSFIKALHIVSETLLQRFVIPKWLWPFRAQWRQMESAGHEYTAYVREMVKERRNSPDKVEMYDIFSGLLAATGVDDDPISDYELEGNLFILLLAGHETAAHTMGFVFGVLAHHQDEQEKLYQHIMDVKNALRAEPTFDDMPRFNRCLAVVNETLRLYPAILTLVKLSAEDQQLSMSDGSSIYVPKDTIVEMSIVGMHYHPQYWENPTEFNPDRFLSDDWPRNAFIPFNAGPRACLGRKFFETEAVAFLVTMLSNYKIKPRNPKATRDELINAQFAVSLHPVDLPLVFERRA